MIELLYVYPRAEVVPVYEDGVGSGDDDDVDDVLEVEVEESVAEASVDGGGDVVVDGGVVEEEGAGGSDEVVMFPMSQSRPRLYPFWMISWPSVKTRSQVRVIRILEKTETYVR